MKKGTNKTDNYFERVKQRLHPPKYRYYFFDYLYFKGEQWSKKAFRCSDAFILLEYSEILESLHNQISLRYLFLMQVFQESGYIPYWRHSSFPIDEHLLLWGVYLIYIILFHTFVCFGSLIMAKRGTL